jgi:hypothetical protein
MNYLLQALEQMFAQCRPSRPAPSEGVSPFLLTSAMVENANKKRCMPREDDSPFLLTPSMVKNSNKKRCMSCTKIEDSTD